MARQLRRHDAGARRRRGVGLLRGRLKNRGLDAPFAKMQGHGQAGDPRADHGDLGKLLALQSGGRRGVRIDRKP
jgi:hypothetical protein